LACQLTVHSSGRAVRVLDSGVNRPGEGMWQYAAKVFVTVALVIAIFEVGKRSSFWGAILASLPVTSLLAFIWLYTGTGDTEPVARLSHSIFWLVLASLPLFVILPALLRRGATFWSALGIACLASVVAYFCLVYVLGRFHVRL